MSALDLLGRSLRSDIRALRTWIDTIEDHDGTTDRPTAAHGHSLRLPTISATIYVDTTGRALHEINAGEPIQIRVEAVNVLGCRGASAADLATFSRVVQRAQDFADGLSPTSPVAVGTPDPCD